MVNISIIYPADPIGVIPGGIDPFIRGIIKWAPEDIQFELVGVTTDAHARPVGQWKTCNLGEKPFRFFPVMFIKHPSRRTHIPLSLQFIFAIMFTHPKIQGDVIEFHRIEPSILYMFDRHPKNVFIHQNMEVLRNPKSDILWRRMPRLFYKVEDFLIPKMESLFTVTESGARDYQKRYLRMKDHIHFIPTWMDPEIFFPARQDELISARDKLRTRYHLRDDAVVGVSVGRLDSQKDPILLVEAFSLLAEECSSLHIILIGDGVLRKEVEKRINEIGLNRRIFLAGLLPAQEIAQIHRGSDLFLLSSAYEGMPIALLEALGSGLTVVATAVGEVPRVVKPGCNGELVYERTKTRFANALQKVVGNLSRYKREASIGAVAEYTPMQVLEPVYQNYRRLAHKKPKAGVDPL